MRFYAEQRVDEEHKGLVSNLFKNIYTNNVEAFIGINASGKTTALKVISAAICIINAKPLNESPELQELLWDGYNAEFVLDYFSNDMVCRLKTNIETSSDALGNTKYSICEEYLWKKSIKKVSAKTKMLDFDETQLYRTRDNNEQYLPSDVSIIIAEHKANNDMLWIRNLMDITNINIFIPSYNSIPMELISYLDSTIETLEIRTVERKPVIKLKFYGSEYIEITDYYDLKNYLSSGTIKGVTVFIEAINTLKNGGYMIVDEIENHFNKELVASLIRLFLNKRVNIKGATLIFSTHYAELLDELDRNDSVFVTRNNGVLTIENLHKILSRNDIKKSDAYQSNWLGGTAPKYEEYMKLKNSIINQIGAEV